MEKGSARKGVQRREANSDVLLKHWHQSHRRQYRYLRLRPSRHPNRCHRRLLRGGRRKVVGPLRSLLPNLYLKPLQHQHNASFGCTNRRAEHQGKIHGIRLSVFLILRESSGQRGERRVEM